MKCKLCNVETKCVFNIKFKAVSICEECGNNIMLQSIHYLVDWINEGRRDERESRNFTHSGIVCCEGCFKLGVEEGKKLMTTTDEIKDRIEEIKMEIEKQRVLLQTYLVSDMNIDEMGYDEVINYALTESNDSHAFLGHWKDYAYLRGKLMGVEEGKKQHTKVTNNNDKLSQSYLDGRLVGFYEACEDIKSKITKSGINSCLISKDEVLNIINEIEEEQQ